MTATRPSGGDVRECRLYRFWVEDPITGKEVLGYIGETVRTAAERMIEHLRDQPWFDTVTRWERDPRIFYGKPAVLEAEAAAIRAERPLYNVKENEANNDRIPPPLAIRQRRARDAAHGPGHPRWVHPNDRGAAGPRLPAPPVRKVRVRRKWTTGQVEAALLGGVWLLLTLIGWISVLHWHVWQLGWRQASGGSAVLAFIVVGWIWLGCPVTKRQRRRAWRRLTRKKVRR